ncbi:hypothetical protein SAMN04488554_3793 [Ruania alba]|uniref:Uncharacterized protein n=1 Tax=Ruania alba TaxID=648782 RepID=A0A1H5MZJ3_9MICO|nr:hypothetical protein SAMN04488554_3793 [Ruania alba]
MAAVVAGFLIVCAIAALTYRYGETVGLLTYIAIVVAGIVLAVTALDADTRHSTSLGLLLGLPVLLGSLVERRRRVRTTP